MKKSILSLGGVAVLSSEEQKMVKGGACAWINREGVVSWADYSQNIGARVLAAGAVHYCCASCGTVSWLQH